MPGDDVVLTEEQAAWVNRITGIDRRIAELDDTQAALLNAGMKAPAPLGAGMFKREEQSNEETHERLLKERARLVARLRSSRETTRTSG